MATKPATTPEAELFSAGLEYTKEQLLELKKRAIEMSGSTVAPNFTCDNCVGKYRCPYAYDLYSTNGDCLAEK